MRFDQEIAGSHGQRWKELLKKAIVPAAVADRARFSSRPHGNPHDPQIIQIPENSEVDDSVDKIESDAVVVASVALSFEALEEVSIEQTIARALAAKKAGVMTVSPVRSPPHWMDDSMTFPNISL